MLNHKVLLMEDDIEVAVMTKLYLEANGFDVYISRCNSLGIKDVITFKPSVVLVGLRYPGENGARMCEELRLLYQGVIIVLTSLDDSDNEIYAFKFGVDDYITMPVTGRVLSVRIKKQLCCFKNNETSLKEQHKTVFSSFVFDHATKKAYFHHQFIPFTQSELEVLELLISNINQVVTRDFLFESTRGIEYCTNNRSIDMRIAGLRKKLVKFKVYNLAVKSVRNKGYILNIV